MAAARSAGGSKIQKVVGRERQDAAFRDVELDVGFVPGHPALEQEWRESHSGHLIGTGLDLLDGMMTKASFSGKFLPRFFAFGVASMMLLLTVGCATKTINHILADPSRYRNNEVKLSGTVVDSYSVLDRGAYQISDGTGRLWIISSRGVPRTGAKVKVTGRVREGANLGNLGGRINLPPNVAAGIVMIETSHSAKR